jgi:hypothetical protein
MRNWTIVAKHQHAPHYIVVPAYDGDNPRTYAARVFDGRRGVLLGRPTFLQSLLAQGYWGDPPEQSALDEYEAVIAPEMGQVYPASNNTGVARAR